MTTDHSNDLHDIYEAPRPESEPNESLAETTQRALKHQRILNLSTALLAAVSFFTVIGLAVWDHLSLRPESDALPAVRQYFVPAHSLPREEKWALDYRSIAEHAPEGVQAAFCTKWIKNAAYHLIMGEQALKTEQFESAQVHFEEALKLFPELQDARRALGLALLKQKKFAPAIEVLEQALKNKPNLDVLVNLGAACLGAKEYEQAEKYLLLALEESPSFAGCHRNLALLYEQTGRPEQAEEHFKRYFDCGGRHLSMIRLYADFLDTRGHTADAVDFLDKLGATESIPVQLMLARNAARTGNAGLAVNALNRVAARLPPALTLAEMNHDAFEKIRRLDAFEELTRRLELDAVSLSAPDDFQGRLPDAE